MKPNIGIEEKNRQAVANELATVLSDEYVLYTKTRNAHWNVEGIDFFAKHKFFEGQYEQINEFIDSVAERIRQLGHFPPSSLKQFLGLTQLTEATKEKNDSQGFIHELLEDHETIIIKLRENINRFVDEFHDAGTCDFITGLMKEHEQMAWFLRAHL
jgi:starvation-inducible DNA-binding protein